MACTFVHNRLSFYFLLSLLPILLLPQLLFSLETVLIGNKLRKTVYAVDVFSLSFLFLPNLSNLTDPVFRKWECVYMHNCESDVLFFLISY